LALNSGEWVRLFRFITSLQSLSLMMEEALICVQLLSIQRGPLLAIQPVTVRSEWVPLIYLFTIRVNFPLLISFAYTIAHVICVATKPRAAPASPNTVISGYTRIIEIIADASCA